MPKLSSFDYAVVRLVPHVEREEFINVGVILFCRTEEFLAARVALDAERVAVLAPDFDVALAQAQLDLIPRICAGDPEAGPVARLGQPERFHWLVSPRSTVLQVSPVHCGLCRDPQRALDDLFARLID